MGHQASASQHELGRERQPDPADQPLAPPVELDLAAVLVRDGAREQRRAEPAPRRGRHDGRPALLAPDDGEAAPLAALDELTLERDAAPLGAADSSELRRAIDGALTEARSTVGRPLQL